MNKLSMHILLLSKEGTIFRFWNNMLSLLSAMAYCCIFYLTYQCEARSIIAFSQGEITTRRAVPRFLGKAPSSSKFLRNVLKNHNDGDVTGAANDVTGKGSHLPASETSAELGACAE